jgi:uncharacterized protein YndB with AHSA1/START domain
VTDTFRTSVRIAAPPEQVFPYLVEPDQLVRWMGTEASVDPRPGGRYDLVVNGLGISGHVEVYDPPKRLVVSWGYIDSPDLAPGASTVEIVLTADGRDTVVELTHRGLDARQRRDHRAGWLHWLERLRVAAAGGDPGPDTPPDRPASDAPVD